MTKKITIDLPEKIEEVLGPPRGSVSYRCMYGGRGSAKSYSAALIAAIWAWQEKLRILVVREMQTSIRESFHAELKSAIEAHDFLQPHFEIGQDFMRGKNGTEFIFRGLYRNTSAIKSLSKIDLTIIEEAEDLSEESWLDLEPTIFRKPKSELWAIWNPRKKGSPVDKRFIIQPPKKNEILIAKVSYKDNCFFPEGLEKLRTRQRETLDPGRYAHVWEGEYLEQSEAQIFSGRIKVKDFSPTPEWHGPYIGLDWGFSQDPTAAIKAWIHEESLYIEREVCKVGLEIDATPQRILEDIPEAANLVVRADSARPESISYVKRNGIPRCESVKKWPGSVEDGIEHIKTYKNIFVHPRCNNFIKESELYSYKVDKKSGDVMRDIVDEHNHLFDALRYALQPMISRKQDIFIGRAL